MHTYELRTAANGAVDITPQVREAVRSAAVEEGIIVIHVPHTTAGVSVIAHPDPLVLDDLAAALSVLVPTRIDFRHQYDTPQDAAGHIKSALFGTSLSLIVSEGDVVLGSSQKVYFLEFDGPRDRRYLTQIVGR